MSELPGGWEEADLGSVCRVLSGATPKTGVSEYWGQEVRWITPNDLSKDRSQVINMGERSLTHAGYESCSAQLFPAGSVIVSSRAPIGYVAIAGSEMCTNQGCKTAVPPGFIDSHYLYWYMTNAKEDLEVRASGTTFKEISGKGFAATILRWPPLEEQRRIVAILEDHLSHLDTATTSLQMLSRRLVILRRSLLQAIFGSTSQPRVPLATLVERIEAGKSLGASARPAKEGEWGIIKVSAMTYGEFRPEENKAISGTQANPAYEIRSGDLLLSRANTAPLVGASVLVRATPPKLLLSDKSLRLKPKSGVEAEWLWRVLQSPSCRTQISQLATGTKDSMRNISQKALLGMQVPDATHNRQEAALAEFDRYQEVLSRAETAIRTIENNAHILRRSLLAAAFRGDLTADWRAANRTQKTVGAACETDHDGKES